MSTTVRISLNKKLIDVLHLLHQEYPTLDDSEIFKLALSELVQAKTASSKKVKNSNLNDFLSSYKKSQIKISNSAKNYTDFKSFKKQNYKYE